jgi:hypothetical protein
MAKYKGPRYTPDRGMYRFIGSCPDFQGIDIRKMVEASRQITRRTFMRYVDKDDMRMLEAELGYGPWLRMSKDWHVSYHKSVLLGWPVVYFTWSAYEHIFASPIGAQHIWSKK